MLDLTFNTAFKSKAYTKSFFEGILEQSAEVLGFKTKIFALSVNIVNDNEIRKLNKKHRDKDEATDVLSFPLLDKSDLLKIKMKKAGKQSKITKEALSDIINLGDVFISLPTAQRYAQEEGIDLKSKTAFLAVHGFLHLLGYGHDNAKDRNEMFGLQDKILKKSGF